MPLSLETNKYVEEMFHSFTEELSRNGVSLHPQFREQHDAIIANCDLFTSRPNCAVLYGGKAAETLWSQFADLDPKRALTEFQPIQATEGGKWLKDRQQLFVDDQGQVSGLTKEPRENWSKERKERENTEDGHLWRVASCCYADRASGRVTALTMNSKPTSTCQRDELFVAINNPDVTHTNGIETCELRREQNLMTRQGVTREQVTQKLTDRIYRESMDRQRGIVSKSLDKANEIKGQGVPRDEGLLGHNRRAFSREVERISEREQEKQKSLHR